MRDYVIYEDTDSCYININDFILDNINDKDAWLNLSDTDKIEYIKRISKIIENHVNDRTFNITQKEIYNSTVEDFKITWEQEKIAKSGLFIKKKKYATHTIIEDGMWKDKISITGLEIIRGDTPLIFKEGLNKILEMILKNYSDEDINKVAKEYIKKAKKMEPDKLSSNTGINNINKYIDKNGNSKKGAPWHVKGLANYRKLLKLLNIENNYPVLHEGVKTKVIYIKKNPYGIDAISYQVWPKEFNDIGIVPDFDKMIDKFFIAKIDYLLTPEGKQGLLQKMDEKTSLFF